MLKRSWVFVRSFGEECLVSHLVGDVVLTSSKVKFLLTHKLILTQFYSKVYFIYEVLLEFEVCVSICSLNCNCSVYLSACLFFSLCCVSACVFY